MLSFFEALLLTWTTLRALANVVGLKTPAELGPCLPQCRASKQHVNR